MQKKGTHNRIASILIAVLCAVLFVLSGCARSSELATLPAQPAQQAQEEVYSHYLNEGAAIEAFDLQAVSALESAQAEFWYPQYLATVVIAVDRDATDVSVGGWNDLYSIREGVGFNNANMHGEMMLLAMAYGLEGDGFTMQKAGELWFTLQAENRLETDSFSASVVVCYDYQAVAQNKNGRNLEIILPEEGTLTYEKGLITNTEIPMQYDLSEFFIAEGFRTLDGRSGPLYPEASAYASAARISDYDHASAVYADATNVLRRNVLYTRLITARDNIEYQIFILLYMVMGVVWTASVMRRAMQKQVRTAALITGILLMSWAAMRLVNYQLSIVSDAGRYLWYGYYVVQLALPAVILQLAVAMDRGEGSVRAAGKNTPRHGGGCFDTPRVGVLPLFAILNGLLAALTLTNDLHNLVFRMDLGYAGWSSEYEYGAGFCVVMAGCFLPLVTGLVIMMVKAWRSPRRAWFALPVLCAGLLLAYAAGYVLRAPIAWESDSAIIPGIFSLVFFESAIKTGLVPVNTKYATLFTHSPLNMRIMNNSGQIVFASKHAFIETSGQDTLAFSDDIPGGTVSWKEDISALNRLHRELEESVGKLRAANAILSEEERIKRETGEEKARTLLLTQLETEIARHTKKLEGMAVRLKDPGAAQDLKARAALLLCYIKRRCNLFFRERETAQLPPDELQAYMEELADLAGYAGVKIISTFGHQSTENHNARFEWGAGPARFELDVGIARLMYDLFYNVVDWAAGAGDVRILAQVESEESGALMRLTLPEEARAFELDGHLRNAIATADGDYAVKDLEAAIGISLAFRGGENHA